MLDAAEMGLIWGATPAELLAVDRFAWAANVAGSRHAAEILRQRKGSGG